MSQPLAGKVAIVTGASKGIGAGIARELASAGAAVAVNYASSRAGAEAVVAAIEEDGGRAVAIQADLRQAEAIRRLFAETVEAFGRLDILVNNAGVYAFAPLAAVNAEHFHSHFELNVLAPLLAMREAVTHFGPEGGNIINISSGIVRLALPDASVYTASKAALDALSRSLAKELGPRIRVNTVNPGMVVTEGVRAAGLDEGDMRGWIESNTPVGRLGQVEDVAPLVAFLASPAADYITGESIFPTGGLR